MIVVDASAVLAFVYAEPGHQEVRAVLDQSVISAVNWSETLQKITVHGGDPDRQGSGLTLLGLDVEPFTRDDASQASHLYPQVRHAGLSLGDRCCLALAARLGVPVLTADRSWSTLDIGIDVRQIG